jgi:hypothetical protein
MIDLDQVRAFHRTIRRRTLVDDLLEVTEVVGVTPDARYEATWRIIEALGMDPNSLTTAEELTERLESGLRFALVDNAVANACVRTWRKLCATIADAVNEGARDPSRIVVTADFGQDSIRFIKAGFVMSATPSKEVVLAAGLIHGLPPGHATRSLLPDNETYLFDNSTKPALVLGPVDDRTGNPRPWYPVGMVAGFTRAERRKQLAAEREREEHEKRDRLNRANAFRQTALGILQQQIRLLEQLENDGELPPGLDDPPQPAVRTGGDGPSWAAEVQRLRERGLLPAEVDGEDGR